MRISDWSSDVCSSDLSGVDIEQIDPRLVVVIAEIGDLLLARAEARRQHEEAAIGEEAMVGAILVHDRQTLDAAVGRTALGDRSEGRRVGKQCVSTFSSRVSPAT